MNGLFEPILELSLVPDKNPKWECPRFFDLKVNGKDTNIWFSVNDKKEVSFYFENIKEVRLGIRIETDTYISLRRIRKRKS